MSAFFILMFKGNLKKMMGQGIVSNCETSDANQIERKKKKKTERNMVEE